MGKKFAEMLYRIIILLSIILALLFFILGNILNERYFLKFSPDKQLKEETIIKINILRIALLFASSFIFAFTLSFIYLKKRIIIFISNHKKAIQNILLLIFILFIIFLVSEIILNIRIDEQTLGGGFGPGSLKFNQKYVHLNNDGMRDREFLIAKPKNTIRIAIIGDSFTFGSGIKNFNDGYPKLLEARLNSVNTKYNYEVLNFGLPGQNTESELEILKEKALKYLPDIVIIGYVLNDMKNVDDNAGKYRYITLIPYFGFWLRNIIYTYPYIELKINYLLDSLGLKDNAIESTKKIYQSELNKDYNEKLFKELEILSKEKGFKVAIVIFPGLINFENYPYLEIHKYIKKSGEENGFYVLDLLDDYKEYDATKLIVSKYDPHPNELGHKIATNAILEKLINNKII